jgi:hypothetical protein
MRYCTLDSIDKKGDFRRKKKNDESCDKRSLKKNDFAKAVYLSEASSPPRFLPWSGQAIF